MLNSLRGASPENTPKAFAKLEAVAADLSSTVLKKVQELSFGQDAVAEHGSALIEHAAEQGNAAALVILADRKFSGFKSDRDIAEGIRLLKKAAQTGYPEALKALAAAYEVGFGVTQNDVEAQRLRNGIAMQQGELLQ
jgi:TPR repeat protein